MIQNDKAEPRSAWEVKRKMRIPAALKGPADATTVERALGDIDGVLQVSANGIKGTALVRYLVTKTDYEALITAVQKAGYQASLTA
jgi:copper chaperone CopZ